MSNVALFDQFEVIQDLGPGCSRVRDRTRGNPGLLHELRTVDVSAELLDRLGVLLALGERAGVPYAITQDRPDLVDIKAWAALHRNTSAGELSMTFPALGTANVEPGEFTRVFQPQAILSSPEVRSHDSAINVAEPGEFTRLFTPQGAGEAVVAAKCSAGEPNQSGLTPKQRSVSVAPDFSKTHTMQIPASARESAPVDEKPQQSLPAVEPPAVTVPAPSREQPRKRDLSEVSDPPSSSVWGRKVPLGSGVDLPHQAEDSAGASGLFGEPDKPLFSDADEKTKVYPAFRDKPPEGRWRAAPNAHSIEEPNRVRAAEMAARKIEPLLAHDVRSSMRDSDLVRGQSDPLEQRDASAIFRRSPQPASLSNHFPSTEPADGTGEYTRIIRPRQHVRQAETAAAVPQPAEVVPPTDNGADKKLRSLGIAVAVLGALLLISLVAIAVLLIRH